MNKPLLARICNPCAKTKAHRLQIGASGNEQMKHRCLSTSGIVSRDKMDKII